MINSELKSNRLDTSGTGMHTYHKQPPITTKKVVLTDVQNDNRSLIRNHQESLLCVEGRPISDTVKVCGTKRLLTPESPSSYPFPPPLSNIAAKDHLMYARKKFEFEPEKGRIQNSTKKYVNSSEMRNFCNMQQEIPRKQTQMRESNIHCVPVVTPNQMAPKMTFSYAAPSLPISLGKPGNGVRAAERDCLKASSEVPHFTNSKRADDQQWEERFIHLQKFLKTCDESNNRDLIQSMFLLSSSAAS